MKKDKITLEYEDQSGYYSSSNSFSDEEKEESNSEEETLLKLPVNYLDLAFLYQAFERLRLDNIIKIDTKHINFAVNYYEYFPERAVGYDYQDQKVEYSDGADDDNYLIYKDEGKSPLPKAEIVIEGENEIENEINAIIPQRNTQIIELAAVNDHKSNQIPENILNDITLIERMLTSRADSSYSTLAEMEKIKNENRSNYKLQVLIYLILAHREPKSQEVNKVLTGFRELGFSLDYFLSTSESAIRSVINNLSFSGVKSRNIHKLCKSLKEKYNSDPPETLEDAKELLKIGPKLAEHYLYLISDSTTAMINSPSILRVANRLKWRESSLLNQELLEDLEELIPNIHKKKFSLLTDDFGNEICTKVNPKCHNCLLKETCPSASISSSNKSKHAVHSEPSRKNKNNSRYIKKKKLTQVVEENESQENDQEASNIPKIDENEKILNINQSEINLKRKYREDKEISNFSEVNSSNARNKRKKNKKS